jgi:hypothetical protein
MANAKGRETEDTVFRKVPLPQCVSLNHYTLSELGDYETKRLRDMGFQEVRYWYANGGYDGDGELLASKGGRWYYHYLGLCSCYGPVDHFVINEGGGWETLDEYAKSCSAKMLERVQCLLSLPPLGKGEPQESPDMDPDEALRCARLFLGQARKAEDRETGDLTDALDALERLSDAFEALDDWISKGGCLPNAWRK